MITYPISSNLCKKVLFTIFHLSEAATGGALLEKVFLEIFQNFKIIRVSKLVYRNQCILDSP